MTKLKNPLLSLRASGSLSKLISFVRRHGVDLVEKRPVPTDAESPPQLAWRTMFNLCVDLWHTLSVAEKQSWESAARPRHMTGYAWYISQCLRPNPGIYLPLLGGTMQGDIEMDGFHVHGLSAPIHGDDATRRSFVNGRIDADIATHAALTATHGAVKIPGVTTGQYTGTGINNRAIAHGLGKVPIFVFIMSWDGSETSKGRTVGNRATSYAGGNSAVSNRTDTYFWIPQAVCTFNATGVLYDWMAIG